MDDGKSEVYNACEALVYWTTTRGWVLDSQHTLSCLESSSGVLV